MSTWHDAHERARAAIMDIDRLPAHAIVEFYSVMTRMPLGRAVSPETAVRLLRPLAPGPALMLSARAHRELPARLAAAGVAKGPTYDGVVALEADAHGETLISLDVRAERTYSALGVAFKLL